MRRILRVGLLSAATTLAAVGQAQSPVTRESRPVRLLRTWHDPVKTPRGDVWRRVDVVYDYGQAAAFERVYTMDGRLIRKNVAHRLGEAGAAPERRPRSCCLY